MLRIIIITTTISGDHASDDDRTRSWFHLGTASLLRAGGQGGGGGESKCIVNQTLLFNCGV